MPPIPVPSLIEIFASEARTFPIAVPSEYLIPDEFTPWM
jgi:hypothetical protein